MKWNKGISPKYNVETREQWFQWWLSHDRNVLGTAKHFGIHRSIVRRWWINEEWEKRADKILAETQAKIDHNRVKVEVSNVKIARGILGKELAAYQNENKATGALNNIIALMRYIDEREGVLPPESRDTHIHGDVNVTNVFRDRTPDEADIIRRNIAATYRF